MAMIPNAQSHQVLYPLMREYMKAVGTSQTTLAALKSYADAVGRLDCTDSQFRSQLSDLNGVIRRTEPTVVPLVHLIEEFEVEMQPHFGKGIDTVKAKAVEIIRSKLKRFETDTRKLTERCMALISPDDLIIVHSPTAYIRNALVRTHTELNRPFKVLILKQDFYRTKDLVDALNAHGVDHLLIAEHNLSHYLNVARKLFFSAVTITADRQAVTGLGTANVVSICHAHKVPSYLFAESIKFSHKPLGGQSIYKEERKRIEKQCEFQMTAFSHDFVDLKMVDHLITENGKMAKEKIS